MNKLEKLLLEWRDTPLYNQILHDFFLREMEKINKQNKKYNKE
jgi:GTP cyclohydrolase II